jgi:hypothetical protein
LLPRFPSHLPLIVIARRRRRRRRRIRITIIKTTTITTRTVLIPTQRLPLQDGASPLPARFGSAHQADAEVTKLITALLHKHTPDLRSQMAQVQSSCKLKPVRRCISTTQPAYLGVMPGHRSSISVISTLIEWFEVRRLATAAPWLMAWRCGCHTTAAAQRRSPTDTPSPCQSPSTQKIPSMRIDMHLAPEFSPPHSHANAHHNAQAMSELSATTTVQSGQRCFHLACLPHYCRRTLHQQEAGALEEQPCCTPTPSAAAAS